MNNGKANHLIIQTSSSDAMEEDFICSHYDWFYNLRNSMTILFPIHNRNDNKTINPWEKSIRKWHQQYYPNHKKSTVLSFFLAYSVNSDVGYHEMNEFAKQWSLDTLLYHQSFNTTILRWWFKVYPDYRCNTISHLEWSNSFNEMTSYTKFHWNEMIIDSSLHWFMINLNNDPFNTKAL